MQFKAGNRKPKATLEIGGVEYKVMKPTLDQADKYYEAIESCKSSSKDVAKIMREYICDLGSIPNEEIGKMENDMFLELFRFITDSEKKS